ncbi:1,2-phenylacetyl-CoA epoxidase subunit PaaC [Bacillus sp. FJAT-18017]|uniref:1,2-phenylacetyl-CoA epoxidase subunit PaaC n=1 Tax=Bacillus sp. FJAT-18017 TaxID=1705566 RepID=UPI000AD04BA8
MQIQTPEQAAEKQEYKEALIDLLFQLADDDFIAAYRGSEWLGLSPHIEADIAFASISQDTMGHAAIFYQLLEDVGAGSVDELAHGRAASERKNSILLERVNGPGTYLTEPEYDWAFAVVRSYFYTVAKRIKMSSLMNSSYVPLADAARRVNVELYYHHLHWKTWFIQLMSAGGEARGRMEAAIKKVCTDFADIFSYGTLADQITKLSLIESSIVLENQWNSVMKDVFESLHTTLPDVFGKNGSCGRNGEHTQELEDALEVLSEVYRFDPAAGW